MEIGRQHSKKIIIKGIIYNSIKEASQKLPLSLDQIKYRLKNKKDGYSYY